MNFRASNSKLLILVLIFLINLQRSSSQESDLYAILISTSKYWFNYRQSTNIMLIYHKLKEYGVQDENIILMIPENTACNGRNNDPGILSCYDGTSSPNLYKNFELDYKGLDVNVENILNILRGRYPKDAPESKKIHPRENSRLLIYLTGHGGNQYSKIQDTHVIGSYEYGKAIEELFQKNMYKEILAINDSCEAVTIWDDLISPNIFAIGSSPRGIRSYSHGHDNKILLSKVDKFSSKMNEFLNSKFTHDRTVNLKNLLDHFDPEYLKSKPGTRNLYAKKNEKDILLKDFLTNQKSKVKKYEVLSYNDEKSDFQEDYMKILLENTTVSEADFLINEY